MIAFDADVLTEVLQGKKKAVARAAQIPVHEQSVPIIVVEEVLRGRLNCIRQAESGKGKLTIVRAYELFNESISDFRSVTILPYSAEAETQFLKWQAKKIRVGTHDLRIAAICVVHTAKLVTRNRRDFEQVPRT